MPKFSTGLRNGMLDDTGAKTQLTGGLMHVYGGAVPATADAAVTGTLLATFSDNGTGTGLNYDTPVGAVLSKAVAQVWKTNAASATGTATYFRLVGAGDVGTLSTTAPRIQGEAGTVGTDMILGNLLFTSGAPRTLNNISINLPTP